MKKTLKKCLFAALAFAASLAPSVFAQDADWGKVPALDVKNIKYSTANIVGMSGKWAIAALELRALANPVWASVAPDAPIFKTGNWLNNVKVTLTLGYPMTNTALSGMKARGSKEDRAKALKESQEETGVGGNSKLVFYRASVTLVGLEIGAGQSSYVNFLIPSEIVDRESKLSNQMSGPAKPKVALVEFSYGGNDLPVCNTKNVLLSRKALDFPTGPIPPAAVPESKNFKSPADWVKWVQDNASSTTTETKGLLIPHYFLPFGTPAWPAKNVPAIIFENIEQ